jgi:hypothetical protein
VISFDNQRPAHAQVEEIAGCLERILSLPEDLRFAVHRSTLDRYSARTMTGRLAEVFDHACASELRKTVDHRV